MWWMLWGGLKLLYLALRPGTRAPALSRLDDDVVRCLWPEILNPDRVVVVAIRLMGAAPRLFGDLRQIIRVRAVAYDAAAGSSRGPRDFGRRFRGLLDQRTVGDALRFLGPSRNRK